MLLSAFIPILACTIGSRLVQGITLDADDAKSIKSAAATVAAGMMSHYTGDRPGDNPGNLPPPYYWWEAGAMFGHMVEYWYYTGDDTYNDKTKQAIIWQAGKNGEFMPPNQTLSEGNDDQIFWAFAAMSAAEFNFPAPPDDSPSYLAMAQAVFALQSGRWDNKFCGGGLRWQISPNNKGWNYKNAVANGGLFQLSARLARYTGNTTYVHWAEKEWDWFSQSVLFDPHKFEIYDGADVLLNCTEANHQEWTYNYGLWFTGLAFLHDATGDDKWLTPLKGILNTSLQKFYPDNKKVLVETTCEPTNNCDTDNLCFKSLTMRWLAVVAQIVPSLSDQIQPYLKASGIAAAGQCDGGDDGKTCGMKWSTNVFDGSTGVGQQMSALAAIDSNMLRVDKSLKPPYTTKNGGTSKGDVNAGTGGDSNTVLPSVATRKITGGDKFGAGLLTFLSLGFTLGGGYWLVGMSG